MLLRVVAGRQWKQIGVAGFADRPIQRGQTCWSLRVESR